MTRRGHESAAGGGSEALEETRDTPQENLAATPVAIGTETVWIGELSLNQTGALMRTLLKAASRMDEAQRGELKDMTGTDTANVAAALSLLDEATIATLFSIVLGKPADWCGENVKARHVLAIIDAVVERNDWKELWAGFLRLRGRFESSQAAA